jgi:quinol monooxygenase YgiN
MSQEVLSIAVFEPYPGDEQACLATLHELSAILAERNYGQDCVYRDRSNAKCYVLVRHWASDAARRQAQEDPAVQKCWAQLAHLMTILKIYESLDEMKP